MKATILVAEHDPASQCVIELTLRQRMPDYRVVNVKYAYELFEQLEKRDDIALVICDMSLPDMSGLEVVAQLKRSVPNTPVLVGAGVRDAEKARDALKRGAVDFIRKSDSPQRIADLIKGVLKRVDLDQKTQATPQVGDERLGFATLIGASDLIKGVMTHARQAALSDIPVLLKGESGVGKERFARAIHEASLRSHGPFVAVNCGAIPDNLVESTLFGHEKGAFTGAIESMVGRFGEADGGTLFLDELGELKQDIQVKLLRALQEKEIQPVGGFARKVDVRIISATNQNLDLAVDENRFREDLYYRLNVFPIDLPSLRDRGERDIRALTEHFVKQFATQEGKDIQRISDAAVGLLLSYDWPGNIRQLENAVYRAVVLAEQNMLRVEDFMQISNALHQRQLQQQKESVAPTISGSALKVAENTSEYRLDLLDAKGDFKSLRDLEAEILKKALSFFRWHITNISGALGVTRATVYKKMKQAGLEDPRRGGAPATDSGE
ncbi:MAG: sigma-54 dependent transcriptional regulator [Rickettsiales bacterium]|nr:sigma-54 dependent transcriptional regulator [Rickettsiales bacterium]